MAIPRKPMVNLKHHTKEKGDLGVLKAQADIAEQGFKIFVPLSETLLLNVLSKASPFSITTSLTTLFFTIITINLFYFLNAIIFFVF